MSINQETISTVRTLLDQADIQDDIHCLHPTNNGGNNRIFLVETTNGKYVAKQYFRHEGDSRDRLNAEYCFLQYASKTAHQYVPTPFSCDAKSGWALYEYIEGSHLKSENLSSEHISQAAQFFVHLNHPSAKNLSTKFNLPMASEACLSIYEHITLVNNRILMLLKSASRGNEVDINAHVFISELYDIWSLISENITSIATEQNILFETLPRQQICISPSDFGFHNALLQSDGNLKFIDFEYAGFDDPAKMVGDFFAQIAVPVPPEFFRSFAQEALQNFNSIDQLLIRTQLLKIVYQVKWCCIALNIFLPVNLARRKFANPELDDIKFKETQLQKAVQLIKVIKEEINNGIY